MRGGRDVVGSAARAVPFDRSAVSDKAVTNSNSSVSVAEPTMPEAASPQAHRPAVSGAYSPWSVDKPHLEPVVVQRSLEERLERAERELVCARMIDNWHRCQQETARYSRIVADLKRQIAERDAEVSHA
jgi:hypothetical protein